TTLSMGAGTEEPMADVAAAVADASPPHTKGRRFFFVAAQRVTGWSSPPREGEIWKGKRSTSGNFVVLTTRGQPASKCRGIQGEASPWPLNTGSLRGGSGGFDGWICS